MSIMTDFNRKDNTIEIIYKFIYILLKKRLPDQGGVIVMPEQS